MPWCVSNFEAMARIIGARSPDLVVNTGDIAFNGADVEDDLAYARACHAGLDAAVRAVPGNHDVGDNPWGLGVEQPITDPRLERYRRHFGDDFWSVDVASWHFIGANAQLFGSGLAVEEAQWSMASGRPVALFVHKPLFNEHPAEIDANQPYVTPVSRRRLADVLESADSARGCSSSRLTRRSSVDLPVPDRPMTPTTCPRGSSRSPRRRRRGRRRSACLPRRARASPAGIARRRGVFVTAALRMRDGLDLAIPVWDLPATQPDLFLRRYVPDRRGASPSTATCCKDVVRVS
jgi:hypothetical protein